MANTVEFASFLQSRCTTSGTPAFFFFFSACFSPDFDGNAPTNRSVRRYRREHPHRPDVTESHQTREPLHDKDTFMPPLFARNVSLQSIFTKNFFAVSLVNMFGLAGYYAIFVVSTRYLAEGFHASPSTAGFATGIVVIDG